MSCDSLQQINKSFTESLRYRRYFIVYSAMSNIDIEKIKDTENANEWVNWIEEAVSKGYLKYYEYKDFKNIEEIGSGGFGKVYRAKWKNFENYLALKYFFNINNGTAKEIVHEVNYFFKKKIILQYFINYNICI
jgi:serine/threonine protein kinase